VIIDGPDHGGGPRCGTRSGSTTASAPPQWIIIRSRSDAGIKGDRGGMSGLALPWSPPHPQDAQEEGAKEYDNADEQQLQKALRDDAQYAQHHRRDHQQ
jgi:hypothetical protein